MGCRPVSDERVKLKRVYEPATPDDGTRILVDRLWPRGLSKADARIDLWLKEIAPSTELRRWFGHDPDRWTEFRRRYQEELQQHAVELKKICALTRQGTVTLVYGARDERHNDAVVLRDALMQLR
jgi:uncharacterized protein YeaO (DUF488 family)